MSHVAHISILPHVAHMNESCCPYFIPNKPENEPWAHCNTLQHTATHGNTQGSCSGLPNQPWAHCNTLQHREWAMSTLQHTATHYKHREWAMSTRRHTRLILGLIKWAMSTLQLAATVAATPKTSHEHTASLSTLTQQAREWAMSHMNESLSHHIHECVKSHIWKHEAYHTYEVVMHSYVFHMCFLRHPYMWQ